jgi:hypothetical protein
MFKIEAATRFDDVGDPDPSGQVDYAYHGYNYKLSDGQSAFVARTYDDEPGEVTIISPTNALSLPQARDLVNFLSHTSKQSASRSIRMHAATTFR